MIGKHRSEPTEKIESLELGYGGGRGDRRTSNGVKEVSQGQVIGRLAINRLGDHLEISFTMKRVGWAEVILQDIKG